MKLYIVRTHAAPRRGASFETNVTGIYHPLGPAYVGACLREAGHDVRILDLQAERLTRAALADSLKRDSPDAVLFTATTLVWPDVVDAAGVVKDSLPDTIVGVGGPQLSVYPRESLSHDSIDFGVRGEGERTTPEILDAIEAGRSLARVKGSVFRKNGDVVVNPPREEIADLDSIPFPAVDLLPLERYVALSVRHPFASMVTSRGCPYDCNFCYQGYLGKYRARSPRNVVEEMETYVKGFGVREIVTFDETFAVEKERALGICELIAQKDLRFRWDVRTRVDLLDRELLTALKRAGCHRLHLGIESGNPDTLLSMRKGFDIAEVREKVGLAKRCGFEVRGYFMLAYPGESRRDILETAEFARAIHLDWASFTITIGLPETGIYRDALRTGRFEADYWKEFTSGTSRGRPPYFVPEGLKERDLFSLKRTAYLKFYLRPGVIRNMLKWSELQCAVRNVGLLMKMSPTIYRSIFGR